MNAKTRIEQVMKRMTTHKCSKCGHEFPNYPFYDEYGGQWLVCPKCNHKHTIKEPAYNRISK